MQRVVKKVENKDAYSKRVSKIKFRVKANYFNGELKITDIMLQGGSSSSSWNGHPSEVRWSFNE